MEDIKTKIQIKISILTVQIQIHCVLRSELLWYSFFSHSSSGLGCTKTYLHKNESQRQGFHGEIYIYCHAIVGVPLYYATQRRHLSRVCSSYTLPKHDATFLFRITLKPYRKSIYKPLVPKRSQKK